jgi:hypothetical protein
MEVSLSVLCSPSKRIWRTRAANRSEGKKVSRILSVAVPEITGGGMSKDTG